MKGTDIAGYTFKAENLHPNCLIRRVANNNVLHEYWLMQGAEAMLDDAAKWGINRADEHSFDSGDFPKVIFVSQVEDDDETCGECGEPLISSGQDKPPSRAFQKKPTSEVLTAGEATDLAIDWQRWAGEQSMSWGELADWQGYFGELADKFDLRAEFTENGIL